MPKARRIGVIYSPQYFETYIKQARAHADKLGLTLKAEPVGSEREVAAAARKLLEDVDALWLLPDPNVATRNSFKFIVQAASEGRHVPIVAYTTELFSLGALLALAPDLTSIGNLLADLTLRVLAGSKPVDLAVIVPEGQREFNVKLAEAMGLSDAQLWTQLQAAVVHKD